MSSSRDRGHKATRRDQKTPVYMFRWMPVALVAFLAIHNAPILPVNAEASSVDAPRQRKHVDDHLESNPAAYHLQRNPYAAGCLRHELGDDYTRRICNSDDASDDLCSASSRFDYQEIRVHNSNWESSIFYAWIIQILLSERVEVPVTIESVGSEGGEASFYHSDNVLPYSNETYPYKALKEAHVVGDCRISEKTCAHILPEVWSKQEANWRAAIDEEYIDSVAGNGMVGKMGLYIPRSLADREPTLVSHYGMKGKENRKNLAETYGRPTTWLEWCRDISPTSCGTKLFLSRDVGAMTLYDGVAVRWPEKGTEEETKYFKEGLYTGHFRFTDENNCDLFPDTCTGHVVDPPCSWGSYTPSQMYWNDIGLKSNGPEAASGGYSYGSMIDIWRAANATQSAVIMWWWRPDPTIQEFLDTPYEFQPVALATPTEECTQSRVIDFCSPDLAVRRGEKEGSCDYEANAPRRIIAASLKTNTHKTPVAKRSPGYDMISSLQISDLAFDSIMTEWIDLGKRDGATARNVVCKWVARNVDTLDQLFIPRGYPRQTTEASYDTGLLYGMLGFAAFVTFCILVAVAATFYWRSARVVKFAQFNFLMLILLGFFLITMGAIAWTLEPTKATCIAQPWLVLLGYDLAIVPLLIKIGAINKLMGQAKRMKRVELKKSHLFGAVALTVVICIIYLIVWMAVDPPVKYEEWVLTEEGGSTVEVRHDCSSSSQVWYGAAMGWVFLLLLVAVILAWQNRNVRQEFNESQCLAVASYSHFIFAVLGLVTYLLPSSNISAITRAGVTSLLLSLDTLFSICIYFVPKFYSARQTKPPSRRWLENSDVSNRRVIIVENGNSTDTAPSSRCLMKDGNSTDTSTAPSSRVCFKDTAPSSRGLVR